MLSPVSPREAWLRGQDRKRTAKALAFVAAAYACAALAIAAFELLSPREIGDVTGPIIVRLGKPDAQDGPKADSRESSSVTAAAIPEPAAPAPADTAPPVSSPPAPAAAAPSPVATAAPSVPPSASTPKPIPAPQATPSTPPAPPAPVTAPPEQPMGTSPNATTKPQPTASVLARGDEAGNSYEVSVNGSADAVRRSGYEPVHLFMPLPSSVSHATYLAIPDYPNLPGTAAGRRQAFEAAYLKSGERWVLKNERQPPFDDRPPLWVSLEDAGYDLSRAEYKEGRSLRPVTLRFRVRPYSQGAALEELALVTSSGYSDIDEAVLHAFRRAKFSNSGSVSIGGSFTYRF